MTLMRERITEKAVSRLCIGGRIEGYQGRLPGLLEEPLLSLRAKKPLFLVGALGGCTELAIDLLEQRSRPEMTTAVARKEVKHHEAVAALSAHHGGEFLTRKALRAGPAAVGKGGLPAA